MAPLHSKALRSAVALALCASVAAAQIGSPTPELTPKRWMNSVPLTLEELHGKAVLVVVFRTWSEQCTNEVAALSAKFDKGRRDGLVVLGVSSEPPDALAPWIRAHKPSYPVVALVDTEFEKAIGARGDWFPIQAVIDPQGTLTFSSGFAPGQAESKLGEALEKAQRGGLWPKKLERAHELLRDGRTVAAYADVGKVLGAQPTEEERRAALKLRAHLEALAKDACVQARELVVAGRIFEAYAPLVPLAKCTPAFPNAPEIEQVLLDIEATPNFKAEMKAGPLFVAAHELELSLAIVKATEQYRELAKKFDDLALARAAKARLADLAERGMLGYDKQCEDCAKGSKACPRHAEKRAK